MEKLASQQNQEIKDIKIAKLENTVSKLRRDTQELEKAKEKLREEIKTWKKKYEYEQSEHEFYQNSAMESKRKNKLLKVAVGRLQFDPGAHAPRLAQPGGRREIPTALQAVRAGVPSSTLTSHQCPAHPCAAQRFHR